MAWAGFRKNAETFWGRRKTNITWGKIAADLGRQISMDMGTQGQMGADGGGRGRTGADGADRCRTV